MSALGHDFLASWKPVDKLLIFLTFHAASAKEAWDIRVKLSDLIPGLRLVNQVIDKDWVQFRNLRDIILEEGVSNRGQNDTEP